MPQRLPRFEAELQKVLDQQKLAKILVEGDEPAPDASKISRVTHGDPERLRGLPAVGRGTSSTSPGTDPVKALLAKERRLGR